VRHADIARDVRHIKERFKVSMHGLVRIAGIFINEMKKVRG
jgi:hypothetical protein